MKRTIGSRATGGPSGTLAALLSAACLCACAHTAPPPSAPPTAGDAIARMRATFSCGTGIQASAKVDHFGDRGRVRGDVLLFAVRPALVRMDVISPFGVALATLTADGTRFSLADLRDKRFFTGPATACNIARLTAVPIPGHVLVDLLHGEAPVLRHAPTTGSIAWSPHGFWVLRIPSANDAREEIHLAPRPEDWNKPWQEQRMRVLDVRVEQQQYVLYHAELSDHSPVATAAPREDPDGLAPALGPSGPACDAEIPRKIRVEVPDPEADVRFDYRQLTWNPPLPEGTFDQPVPPGMPIEPVHCD